MKRNNECCVTSFVFGIASMFLYQIYFIPVIAIISGIIGISTFDDNFERNKWFGIVGLIFGILYLMCYIVYIYENY